MSFPRLPGQLRLILWATLIGAVVAAVYAEFDVAIYGLPHLAWYGAPRGFLVGAVIASILSYLEVVVLPGPYGAPLRRSAFPVHVAVKTLVALVVILFGLELGRWVFPAPGEHSIEIEDVPFSLVLCFIFVFVLDVNRLLGQNVLLNFMTGRYHQPRLEERIFLFIDMEDSTGLAERLGPLAYHRLLNRFVLDLTESIVAARGEIYGYIGDEVIATWKLNDGIAQPGCAAACFAAIDRLQERAPDYRRDFGTAVNFRAGLHCGPVVTGEMGSVKKEIVFLGDTVNTASRIQELCRTTGDRVLASAELIDRLQLLPGISKRSLGDLRLRGKGADLALYALTRAPEQVPQDEAFLSVETSRHPTPEALS